VSVANCLLTEYVLEESKETEITRHLMANWAFRASVTFRVVLLLEMVCCEVGDIGGA
jgi:hypothetical protein